jgi:glyoxylase I family protein
MPGMRIHHIALRTGDVARLEGFYGGLLGLVTRRREGDRATWLDAAEVVVMLERAEPGEPAVPERTMDLVAFEVDAGQKEAVAARLSAAGIPIEASTAHTIYFRDPDGRRVGLSAYRFE